MGSFEKITKVFEEMSIVILVIYWITFIISMFLCQKIYVVEMIFSLQFAFMSLIPIGVYCPPFSSLKILRYSFGWNALPFKVIR
jgi:hypothetical protein